MGKIIMFSKIIAAAALLAVCALPAAAADMPVKAVYKRATLVSTCGWYWGAHTVAENEKLQVSGTTTSPTGGVLSGIGGVTNIGASVGLTAGYRCGSPSTWYAFEGMASYRNVGQTVMAADPNGTNPAIPATVTGKWGFTQRAKLGGPWQDVLNYLPNFGGLFQAQPLLPAGISDAQAYLMAGLHEDDISGSFAGVPAGTAWRVRVGFGVGTDFALGTSSNGSVPMRQDVWAEYIPSGQGLNVGLKNGMGASLNTGAEIRLGTAIHFNAGAATLALR